MSGFHIRFCATISNSYSTDASAVRAITVRGGVVEITIQHEAQPSGVLFLETHLRVPLSRAQQWRPYYELFIVCVGASKTPTVGPVSQTGWTIAIYQDG